MNLVTFIDPLFVHELGAEKRMYGELVRENIWQWDLMTPRFSLSNATRRTYSSFVYAFVHFILGLSLHLLSFMCFVFVMSTCCMSTLYSICVYMISFCWDPRVRILDLSVYCHGGVAGADDRSGTERNHGDRQRQDLDMQHRLPSTSSFHACIRCGK